MAAVMIVVLFGSLYDWRKARQFMALNEKKEERGVKVVRDGAESIINVTDVLVGDVALLEPGEIIPCDGIYLSGHNVQCNESVATGEADAIRKTTYEELVRLEAYDEAESDCFMISGSKVLEGIGRYVIVAVGRNSVNGRAMMATHKDPEETHLQIKLKGVARFVTIIGSMAGGLLFTEHMIRFFVQLGTRNPQRTPTESVVAVVNILILSVALIVLVIPEGLPLAVTLTLAFATKRMTSEKLLVRVLSCCETMASASVICTDKTGTITQNVMRVVAGSVGTHIQFGRIFENKDEQSDGHHVLDKDSSESKRSHVDQAQLNTMLPHSVRELFNEAIAVNSTAFEHKDPETNELVFVGSETETALLRFAKDLGWRNFKETREARKVVHMIPFSSAYKAMCIVVENEDRKEKGYRVYLKGASDVLSGKCSTQVVVKNSGTSELSDLHVETKPIDVNAEENISNTYANHALRTISLCYRDLESWPLVSSPKKDHAGDITFELLAEDLTLIGIVGIEDPLRDNVREAIADCKRAGVEVKMCTGDNLHTAKSIATQSGILTSGEGTVMEGPAFRRLSHAELIETVPQLQVLARSSPEDKKLLVEILKSIGNVVAVTGDDTNDGPALKAAHVGFSMGKTGTEIAKAVSDIILLDDNFASIVNAIMWGRCVNDSVRKFLLYQLTTSIAVIVITCVAAISSRLVLTAVQLLWIDIIVNPFAALALATDSATKKFLDRKPDGKNTPLFSVEMYKQMLWQSLYQIIIILIFHFLGFKILGFRETGDASSDKHSRAMVQTLVFNAFVFAQIFNSINCRRLDNGLHIFEDVLNNWFFIVVTLLEIAIQILIVFFGGEAFRVTTLGGREWGISLAIGVMPLPLGALIRLMPNAPHKILFCKLRLLEKVNVLPLADPNVQGTRTGKAVLH